LFLKKLICLFLCLLLVAGMGISVSAEPEALKRPAWPQAVEETQKGERELVEMVVELAEASYALSQKSARRSSFQGYCGLMASHQLYNLGLNTTLVVKNGNNQFDYYLPLEKSTGGYYINAYPSEEYSLENAINAVSDFRTQGVTELVLGHPINMDGTRGPRAEKAESFAELLREVTSLPVTLWDERRTTVDAHNILMNNGKNAKERKKTVDAVAAALMLEGYLTRKARGL
jgi:putative Holliday junction resolvase